ncbi:MAG: cell division protein SepF [archaeon]
MAFNFKGMFGNKGGEEEDYLELDLDAAKKEESKVIVKPFVLRDYEGMEEILNSLRTGYTIAVIDIRPLKSKDLIELKRAISKIKKTVDALEGTIAGFGDNIVLATPSFAHIHKPSVPGKKEIKDKWDYFG